MDKIKIEKLLESLIKDYETSETHAILMYSSIHERDFKLLSAKVKDYRKQLKEILKDGPENTAKV